MGLPQIVYRYFGLRGFLLLSAAFLPGLLAAQVGVTFIQTNVTCNGLCNGTVVASGTGGVAPYSFIWSNGSNSNTLNGLCAGNYTVTVTDAVSNTGTGTVAITQPAALIVTMSVVDQICGVVPDGSITANPSGGTPPYTYLWNNNGTTQEITGLAQGVYTVTVTDAQDCTGTAQAFVSNTNEGLWLVVDTVNILCYGDNNGFVHVGAMTGTQPYTYLWSNNETTQDIFNLGPGDYTVTVIDANGCSNVASATVTEPDPLGANVTTTSGLCGQPGSATIIPSGGTPPYTVLWNDSSTTFTIIAGAGMVMVTLTDANGCEFNASLTIPGDTVHLVASATLISGAGCTIGGSAQANASGGSGNYTYIWSNGDTTALATDLLADSTYVVTITEIPSGCTDTASVTVTRITPSLTVQATAVSPVTCLASGVASAVASGGVLPYSYVWDGSAGTATATGLTAGEHVVVVRDSVGCTATDTVEIDQLFPPVVSAKAQTPANCVGGGGSAQATVAAGTPPFTYFWSNGEVTPTAISLPAGLATVIVTDSIGCKDTTTVTILPVSAPVISVNIVKAATCISPATVDLAITGSVGPFTYNWSTGDSTATVNLNPGTHSVIVTDDITGCADTATVTINQPLLPAVSITVLTSATCNMPAIAQATASGGTSPYSYAWDTGVTTPVANLTPGIHTVTVTDAGGCKATQVDTIAAPPVPNISIDSVSNAACNTPGSASASATSGTPPYTWLWDNGDTTPTSNNLSAGVHTVIVTDAGGCSDTASVTIGVDGNGGITLGDFVWYDNDQNGFQHPLEQGVPNIKVKLLQAGPDNLFGTPDDILVATTTTDSTGKYSIACVTPGIYLINFSGIPAGYQFAAKDQVNNDCKDSDARQNGNTDPFIISASQSDNLCWDAGIHVACVNITNAGTICCAQTICEGDTPALLYESVPPAGGVGAFEYVWMQYIQVGSAPPLWVAIPGANQASYQPGPLFATACFMRCVRRAGCTLFRESNIVKITVLPAGSTGCNQFFGDFIVTAIHSSMVKVQWATEPEWTQYQYTVERSTDQKNWTAVDEMMGYQNTTSLNHYQTMDHEPVNGMNYYRIKRRSAGGGEAVSETRSVELKIAPEASLAVYPNPVSQVLNIRNLMLYESETQVELFTAGGARLYSLNIPANTYRHFEIPVQDLPQGIYLVRIRLDDRNVLTRKFSKF